MEALNFPAQSLKGALTLSFLTVWVLVGLFYYLNRYTRRRYFNIWTVAWLFYALWLLMSIAVEGAPLRPALVMLKQWCLGVTAVFLLWGALRFLGERTPQKLFALFMVFLLAWSYMGAYFPDDAPWGNHGVFALLGIASFVTATCFFQFRRQKNYLGAGLLFVGFCLWGGYMMLFPFLDRSDDLRSSAVLFSGGLQLFIAVSMIVLVLEEVRSGNIAALKAVQTYKSEKTLLETRVVSTEERYRSLFDQASEGIIIVTGPRGAILEVNQTAKRLLGVGPNFMGPLFLEDFIEAGATGSIPLGDWLADAGSRERRLPVKRRDGGSATVAVDAAPIQFDGAPACQIFLREITEQARLEQQLRQAEKLSALGRMISGIAHELNNPLAVIRGYLELIMDRHELPPQTRTDLAKVAEESNRAAKLVGNFLSFARQQAGRREHVDLNELIRRIVELRVFELRVANVDLKLELDEHLPCTVADPDQVQQVLINLITNGLQALAEAPFPRRIIVGSQSSPGWIRISVEDNGPGVPPEHVNRIFEPFFTTKDVGTGTGLGLSIAHSIMAEHAGRISFEIAKGGGARFVLDFPVIEPAESTTENTSMTEAETSPEPPPGPKPSCTPGNILVLDDEVSIAELLGEMLTLLGHHPTLCHNGHKALELIASHEFDLVLSDFRMPMMDGEEFYRRVKESRPALARHIIFLTGDVVSPETRSFLQSTGNPFLAKPFQLSKVEEVVAQALQEIRHAPAA